MVARSCEFESHPAHTTGIFFGRCLFVLFEGWRRKNGGQFRPKYGTFVTFPQREMRLALKNSHLCKCKNPQKNLHISNIFIIFAVTFGKRPHANEKTPFHIPFLQLDASGCLLRCTGWLECLFVGVRSTHHDCAGGQSACGR